MATTDASTADSFRALPGAGAVSDVVRRANRCQVAAEALTNDPGIGAVGGSGASTVSSNIMSGSGTPTP